MTTTNSMLSIVMPVRNEGVNIVIMLKILRAVIDVPYEIVIVHDDPKDVSISTVLTYFPEDPRIRLVHNSQGRGVSNACQAGFSASKGDVILLFAVDEVGPVLAIKDMFHLVQSGCDFVSCTRYAYGGRRLGGSLVGAVLSRVANRMFQWLSGCHLTDSTTGIKMFRKKVVESFSFQARPVGWAVAFEMSMKAELSGCKVGEVPIVSIDRLYGGESSFSAGPWMAEYFRWFVWGVKEFRRSQISRPQPEVRVPTWDENYFNQP